MTAHGTDTVMLRSDTRTPSVQSRYEDRSSHVEKRTSAAKAVKCAGIYGTAKPVPFVDSLFPQPLRCCPNWPTENPILDRCEEAEALLPRFHVSIEGFSGVYCVAGNEWCSCMTRHWPAILRKPIVNRNSSGSRLPLASMLTHLPMAVAKSNLLSAGDLHLVKVKGYRFLHRGKERLPSRHIGIQAPR